MWRTWDAQPLIYLLLAAAFLGLVSGCGAAGTATGARSPSAVSPATAGSTAPAEPALLQVIRADGSARGFSRRDLEQLPRASVTVEGKAQEGPAVQEVLRAAGIAQFQRLTISGGGSSLVLSREQVGPDVILDFTNRGTVKLAAPAIPKDQWVKDITTITVE